MRTYYYRDLHNYSDCVYITFSAKTWNKSSNFSFVNVCSLLLGVNELTVKIQSKLWMLSCHNRLLFKIKNKKLKVIMKVHFTLNILTFTHLKTWRIYTGDSFTCREGSTIGSQSIINYLLDYLVNRT